MEHLIQNILVGSIFLLKLAQALDIKVADLAFIKREPGQLLKSVLAADFVTPLMTLLIIFAVHPPRATQIGLAVVAAAPAAPLFIMSALNAGGRIAYVASFQFTLALLAMFTTPFILEVMARILGFEAAVSSLAVAQQVAVALFLPTCLGMFIRARIPAFADRLAPILQKVGSVIFLLVVLLIMTKAYPLLLAFDFRSYLSVILVAAAALAAGHLMGPRLPEDRITFALACASRNPGLAMMIASLNFASADAVHVQIPYLFAVSIPSLIYVQWRKKNERSLKEAMAHPPG